MNLSASLRDVKVGPGPGESGDPHVELQLDEDGATRFGQISQANVHRRIGIVVDGIMMSALVLQEAITGGSLRITMGRGSRATQHRDARQLALRLIAGMGRPKH